MTEGPTMVKKTFTSRKTLFFIVLFLMTTIFLLTGYADFAQWADLIKWLFGVFVIGNVARHGTKALSPVQRDELP